MRGYFDLQVGNPAVSLPPNSKGKFDVGAGVGKGTLQVGDLLGRYTELILLTSCYPLLSLLAFL